MSKVSYRMVSVYNDLPPSEQIFGRKSELAIELQHILAGLALLAAGDEEFHWKTELFEDTEGQPAKQIGQIRFGVYMLTLGT